MMLKILLITPFIMISPATAQQKPPERHYQGPSLLSIDKDLWARALRDEIVHAAEVNGDR